MDAVCISVSSVHTLLSGVHVVRLSTAFWPEHGNALCNELSLVDPVEVDWPVLKPRAFGQSLREWKLRCFSCRTTPQRQCCIWSKTYCSREEIGWLYLSKKGHYWSTWWCQILCRQMQRKSSCKGVIPCRCKDHYQSESHSIKLVVWQGIV